jgi:GT2 family glycosyltransferase
VVIVTYRSQATIESCLESLIATDRARVDIVVVDNSPDQATADHILAFIARRPDAPIRLLPQAVNLGFAAGCNLGAREARGRFLMFLNPDAELLGDVVGILAAFLDGHPRAEVVGPQIRDAGGHLTPTCRRLPTCWRIFLDATGLDRVVCGYRMLRFDHTARRLVDQVMGACFFLRTEDFQRRGGFDERFFIYYEEVDYCRRVLDDGGEVWFEPAAAIGHVGGASCEHAGQVAHMTALLRESRELYFDKHFGLLPRLCVRLIDRLEGAGKAAILSVSGLLRGDARQREKAKGFLDVALGRGRRGRPSPPD